MQKFMLTLFLVFLYCSAPAYAQVNSSIDESTLLRAVYINPQQPLKLFFLITGKDSHSIDLPEVEKTIQYFLSSLTIPDNNLWVYLSPFEPSRLISPDLAKTALGKDLLLQDYALKQKMVEILNPEQAQGEAFWKSLLKKEATASTLSSLAAYGKIWIVPNKASVYQLKDAAVVVDSSLKTLIEDNPVIGQENRTSLHTVNSNDFADILKTIDVAVNHSTEFREIRQAFYAMILATWFKKAYPDSFLAQAFIDRSMTAGLNPVNSGEMKGIYNKYVSLFNTPFKSTKPGTDEKGMPIKENFVVGGVIGATSESVCSASKNTDNAPLFEQIKLSSFTVEVDLLAIPGVMPHKISPRPAVTTSKKKDGAAAFFIRYSQGAGSSSKGAIHRQDFREERGIINEHTISLRPSVRVSDISDLIKLDADGQPLRLELQETKVKNISGFVPVIKRIYEADVEKFQFLKN